LGKVGERKPGLGYGPTIEIGSRQTTSAKQTSAELGFSSHRPRPEHLDRTVEQGTLCQSDTW